MSALYKMGREGHGLVAEWTGTDAAAEKIAAGEFEKLVAAGFTMFDISDGQAGKPVMRAFDPKAGEILAVPRMVGG